MAVKRKSWHEHAGRTGRCAGGEGILAVGLAAILVILTFMVVNAKSALAQKIVTVGSLNTADQFYDAFEGFRSRMAQLGYVEGRNVRYVYHNSKGSAEKLNASANQLVQERVAMIVTTSTTGTMAAAKATRGTNIPVVFLSAANPQLLVKGFSGSGNNLAGISSASLELTAKRFELLKELVPKVKRLVMPVDPNGVNYRTIVEENREAIAKLGLTVVELPVRSVEEIVPAMKAVSRKEYDAIFTPADTLISAGVDGVVRKANEEKLPTITALLVNVKRGCLATYASDYLALGMQGAVLADKILRGAKPSELPVEMPDKIKLALNLKTAKIIGVKISSEMLLRADDVFE